MYVCLTALLKVKAAIPHVKPRSNVGRSKAMVSVFPAQSEDMFGEDMSLIPSEVIGVIQPDPLPLSQTISHSSSDIYAGNLDNG